MRNKLYFCLPILIIGLLSASCNRGEVYYQFQEIKGAAWNTDSLLVFELDTLRIEAGVSYDITIEVTNNVSYPYKNLWLFTALVVDDSIMRERQTEFRLADEDGVWKGKGFGSLHQSSHQMLKSYQFDRLDNSFLYIRHGMTDSLLMGIEKVGIKIEIVK